MRVPIEEVKRCMAKTQTRVLEYRQFKVHDVILERPIKLIKKKKCFHLKGSISMW
jgi:hypothetical protein